MKPPRERKTRLRVPPLVRAVCHSETNNRTEQWTQMQTLEHPIPTLRISPNQK